MPVSQQGIGMAEADEGARITTVENAFTIVEQVAKRDEVGVTELADELDMPKSTVHT